LNDIDDILDTYNALQQKKVHPALKDIVALKNDVNVLKQDSEKFLNELKAQQLQGLSIPQMTVDNYTISLNQLDDLVSYKRNRILTNSQVISNGATDLNTKRRQILELLER